MILTILVIVYIINMIMHQNYLLYNNIVKKPQIIEIQNDKTDAPYKVNEESQLPIIATKGIPTEFNQIGILTNSTKDKILPLFGRRVYSSSSKWNYYTTTGTYHNISLPLINNKRECDNEYGCDELSTNDTLYIDELNDTFTVKLYKTRQYFYKG
jgi:hypothetical protein